MNSFTMTELRLDGTSLFADVNCPQQTPEPKRCNTILSLLENPSTENDQVRFFVLVRLEYVHSNLR